MSKTIKKLIYTMLIFIVVQIIALALPQNIVNAKEYEKNDIIDITPSKIKNKNIYCVQHNQDLYISGTVKFKVIHKISIDGETIKVDGDEISNDNKRKKYRNLFAILASEDIEDVRHDWPNTFKDSVKNRYLWEYIHKRQNSADPYGFNSIFGECATSDITADQLNAVFENSKSDIYTGHIYVIENNEDYTNNKRSNISKR